MVNIATENIDKSKCLICHRDFSHKTIYALCPEPELREIKFVNTCMDCTKTNRKIKKIKKLIDEVQDQIIEKRGTVLLDRIKAMRTYITTEF